MNTNTKCGFITGSRRYGKPKKSSDIDFVVQVGISTLESLLEICKGTGEIQEIKHGGTQTDPGPNGAAFNFGRLNLILVTDDKAFNVWRKGTLQLVKAKDEGKKVTRTAAIKHFAKLRKVVLNKKEIKVEKNPKWRKISDEL